jgi:hypothetical protein
LFSLISYFSTNESGRRRPVGFSFFRGERVMGHGGTILVALINNLLLFGPSNSQTLFRKHARLRPIYNQWGDHEDKVNEQFGLPIIHYWFSLVT